MQSLAHLEPRIETPEDDYEPPPHIFARLGRSGAKLYRLLFPNRTRWSWVGLTLFEAMTYVYFSPLLASHLPSRLNADNRWGVWMSFEMIDAAHRSQEAFLRLVTEYGVWIVLIGPFREEILFRGLPILLARWLTKRLSPTAGRIAAVSIAVVSSLLFAWMHHPVPGAMPLPQLLLGALAWTVAWRQGLRYSVLLHVLVNLLFYVPFVVRMCKIVG